MLNYCDNDLKDFKNSNKFSEHDNRNVIQGFGEFIGTVRICVKQFSLNEPHKRF